LLLWEQSDGRFLQVCFSEVIKVPDLSGTVLDGKYELIRLLGEGGMGTVYEAKHRLIGRRLAVKFLHPHYVTSEEVVTRFQREAQAAAAIGHENIIDVTDMGQTTEGAPYLVMEYLDGMDVRDLLAEAGSLPIEQAAHIMVQALSALQAAHDAGIIHRDLKPENIYLIEKPDRKDYVKLLDFGISKFKSLETEGMKGLTQTGTVLGTPYYMSPEQARGDQNIGTKSDIYAMGVILFQMLTGKLPFDAPNYNALLIKILTEDPPDPLGLRPDLPLDIVETIKIAMARDAKDRFEDCLEFRSHLARYVPGTTAEYQTKMSSASRSAIRAALSSSTMTPLEMTRSGGVKSKKSHTPLVVGIAASTVVVTLTAGYFFWFQNPNSETTGTSSLSGPLVPTKQSVTPPVVATKPIETKPVEVAAEKKEEVRIKFHAKPKTAKISVDGVLGLGNPYEKIVSKDLEIHKIEISADGYESLSADVRFDQDQELAYTLSKQEKEEGSTKSTRHHSSKTTKDKDKDKDKNNEIKGSSGSSKAGQSKNSNSRRRIDDADPWKED
jgi:serine/threonine protein kinase